MRANDEQGWVRTELIGQMLETADAIAEVKNKLLQHVAAWIQREAHLAEARHLAAMQEGLPDDTARFLAVDDMGFQLAHAAMLAWSTP